MDTLLLSIDPRDPLWIALAFIGGLLLKQVGLPPMIGFLAAGFLFNAMGAEGGQFLSTMADLGITLLLFTIGLKLRLHTLARPEVWGVASIHMASITLIMTLFLLSLAQMGFTLFAKLDLQMALMIGFALSFSSTVFAIRVLDELGATNSKHGRVAIGVLVVQDIAAVVFLAVSIGKIPSWWALALVLLVPARHILYKILEKSGHGELLVLFGITLALGGADIFEIVGMKGDVGALVLGMLLAGHPKASELSKALLGFKDLFLIGFFLSVGMTALPGWEELLVALVIILFLPIKVALYYGLFNTFYLRASTSWRSSFNLANYSEFGLIVGALAVSSGWLDKEWLAVFAIVVAVSFVISAPLINVRDNIYQKWRSNLKPLERGKRLQGEEDLYLPNTQVLIIGMGRMGTAAYNAMEKDFRGKMVAVELDYEKSLMHQSQDRRVVNGDATNPDFWTRTSGLFEHLDWVLLTLPTHGANMTATERLLQFGYQGKIAATTKFADEEEALKALGVDWTFNIYAEAGQGFASDLKKHINTP